MLDARYGIIKPKFDEGKIKRFGDIVSIVPKTLLARDMHKSVVSLNKEIKSTETFKVRELELIGQLCDLSLLEMLKIAGVDYVMPKIKNRDDRYGNIHSVFRTGRIKSFEDIFIYIPRSVVASNCKIKSDRLGRLINKVENFSVKEFLFIGSLCYLNKEQTYLLIAAAYESQHSNKRKKS
jgi:hypothetical protein